VVRLPALPSKPEAKKLNPPEPTVFDAPRLRALVVDDDIDGAASLAMLLEFWGHDVRVVYDGATAWKVAQVFHPEVMLVGIGLGRARTGYELAARVRKRGSNRPLMVALASPQEEDLRLFQKDEFDHFLLKPVDPTALQMLLSQIR
jgi:CheY-like chemotaxis protein